MKKILLATVSVIALACSARAADMPVKARPLPAPVASWAGPYIGIQGGYVSHEGEFLDENGFLVGASFDDGSRRAVYDKTKGGAIGGGHLGYNWQANRWVFGIEGDISALSARGKTGNLDPSFTNSFVTFDVKWLATVRARLGLLISDTTLFYLTGGVAFADVRNNASLTVFSINMIEDRVKTGWTVGGGIEHMLARNWTVRAEGRYVDLGSKSVKCSPPSDTNCNFTYRGEFSNTLLMGLVGVSLKF